MSSVRGGFGVQDFGFRVQGLEFTREAAWGLEFAVEGSGFRLAGVIAPSRVQKSVGIKQVHRRSSHPRVPLGRGWVSRV